MTSRTSPETRRAALGQLAIALGPACDMVLGVRHAGSRLDVLVRSDDREIERRRSHRLGPVVDAALLEALAQLPLGEPIPAATIDPMHRLMLDGAPAGVVDTTDGSYTRMWRPAVEVVAVCALATTRRWLPALEGVSTAVGVADRYLVLDAHPGSEALPARALRVGVGVAVLTDGDRAEIVVQPWARARRLGPRRWRFLEAAYSASLGTVRGSPTSHAGLAADRTRRPSDPPGSLRH